jgi:C4-dicarboxylate-specific signal transduction histidine kinase
VLTVSQAVAGELVLEQLLDTLLRTALAQAGAERGLLLLSRGDALRLAAEATTRGDTVRVHLTDQPMAAAALPQAIVQYVMRTHDSVLLDDAAAPHAFAADVALGAPHARSILCVPLLNQARLTGVLYLDNTLTPHVFTPTRSAVLTLLASQAAISLENARLYAERQQAEEALRQTQAELAHIARLTTLGELTASIAHEINQPLGAMVNSANACLRWLAAQNLERARQSAVRIVADGQRAADTITRIRALAHNAPAQKDWLDLNATIRDVLALVRSEVHRHGVVVETHLAADVPRIQGDRIQLQQVLLNLLMNALEALSGGGNGPRELVVQSDMDTAQDVRVTVRDSGPGLDPQGLDRLFDAFYTTKAHGLGLGLAISRSIIAAHGGRLWASANVPHGAVFQFTVPRGSEEGG